MADSKITALTSIGTITDPAVDPLVIVDVSDTSMAATGTTKKVTLNNLLACSPTATLASASITGNLTLSAGTVNGVGYLNASKVLTAGSALVFDGTNLGIGVTPSVSKLHVGITSTATSGLAEANALKIENNNATVNNAAGLFLSQTGDAGCGIAGIATSRTGGSRASALALYYYSQATSASPIEGARLDASGRLLVGPTSANTSGGVLQLSSGITFPATQVASSDANTLDDYEEGTWTPTIIGTTTAGTGTYSTQRGDYIKIGRLVTVQFYVAWTAHTGTGNMNVSGLPFTTQNIGTYFAAAAMGFVDLISMTAGNIMTGYAAPNSTTLLLKQTPTGGGASADIPIDTSGSIIVSLTYIANA